MNSSSFASRLAFGTRRVWAIALCAISLAFAAGVAAHVASSDTAKADDTTTAAVVGRAWA